MTLEELNQKYGDVKVTFTHYYKFTFTFKGTLSDGKTIVARVGGTGEDIYREEITREEKNIRDLYPYYVTLMDGDEEIEFYYER